MPNKIADNVRQKILDAIVARLGTITLANGYNTQPLVTTEWATAETADPHFAIWVVIGDENTSEPTLMAGDQMALELLIHGYVKKGNDDIQKDMNRLLQDVRTAIHTYGPEMRAAIGTGSFQGFGLCETDMGVLSKNGHGLFLQPINVTYSQGEVW